MAELALKIGNSPDETGYQDGDIVCAFNNRRIRSVHAEVICHVKHVPLNRDGLNPSNSLPIHWFENTHQYKFERVSAKEIKRTNLLTLEEDIISDVANANGERINVQLFIDRRLKSERHRIFGTAGAEFWYGGDINTSNTNLDAVWQQIEALTPNREVNFRQWPLSPTEKKHFLALPVDDFDDNTRVTYESSELDENDQIIQKRIHKVNFRNLVTAQQLQDIENKTIEVDLRTEIPILTRTNIVDQKERTR